jgi:hypothetical protein
LNQNQTFAFYVAAGLIAVSFIYRRREAIIHRVRGTLVAFACAVVAFLLLWKAGLSPLAAYLAALVIGVLMARSLPGRSRYISKHARRQAIAKWEKETGQTFNRRIHEIDHKLAHSRGGGNAEDNLQVLTKKQNRSKGAKRRWRNDEG